jgi:aspartyl-tRNA synthetase
MHIRNKSWKVRANAYDMVLNGNEIGGGSIRIHDKATTANVQIFRFHRRTSQRTVWVLNGRISVWSTPHGGLALIRSISCHSWRAGNH